MNKTVIDVLVAEVANTFKNENINLIDCIKCFFAVLQYKITDSNLKLDGIETNLYLAINTLFDPHTSTADKESSFVNFTKIEPYFRKILYLIENDKFQAIEEKDGGFYKLVAALNLNPEGIDIRNSQPDQLIANKYYVAHLCRVYHLRNTECHHFKNYTTVEKAQHIQSLLIIYLYTTISHYKKLVNAIDLFGIQIYLKKITDRYKQWQTNFVHINGEETFQEIDLFAKEVCNEENEEIQIQRKGTIDFLRKNIKESQMVIIGEVGMGKSTTLQYLYFSDAQECLRDNSESIPVYIELKNIANDENLQTNIAIELKIDDENLQLFLHNGKLNIFFDGLNEIEKSIKIKIIRQINDFITEYPKNKFILTSRPLAYKRELDDPIHGRQVPVFLLQTMHDSQIEEFLDKNGKDVKEIILKEININSKLKELVTTPLILSMLINVVRKTKTIPYNKVYIIQEFINGLLRRENKVDYIDGELLHILLSNWAYKSRIMAGGNSGLNESNYVIPFFSDLKNTLGLNFDVWDFLRKVRDIHILTKTNHHYSFIHELYQEYFAAEYLYSIKIENNAIQNVEKIAKDATWEEVIKLYSGFFHNENERKIFILELAAIDPYLATQCEKNSLKCNQDIDDRIIAIAISNINSAAGSELKIKSILTLIEYKQYDTIISYVEEQKGQNIQFTKSIIGPILIGNMNNSNIWTIIKVFIDANPKFYVSNINTFLIEYKEKIFVDKQIIKEVLNTIVKREAKFKQICDFINIMGIHDLSFIKLDAKYVKKRIEKSSSIDDIDYFINIFNYCISEDDIIDIIIGSRESLCLYILVYYMNKYSNNKRKILINKLLNSNDYLRKVNGLMFIKSYSLQSSFSQVLDNNIMLHETYRNVFRTRYSLNKIDDFYKTLNNITNDIELTDYLNKIQVGKKMRFESLYELPHHFLLKVSGNSKVKFLLPKDEASSLTSKRGWGWIKYIDKNNRRIFLSLKPINNDINFFLDDYYYYLFKGDRIKCQPYKFCNKIGFIPKGIHIKTIKLFPKNSITSIDFTKIYLVEIIKIKNITTYEVKLIDE